VRKVQQTWVGRVGKINKQEKRKVEIQTKTANI